MQFNNELSMVQLNAVVGGAMGRNDFRLTSTITPDIRKDNSAFEFGLGQIVCGKGRITDRWYECREGLGWLIQFQKYRIKYFDWEGNLQRSEERWQKDIYY